MHLTSTTGETVISLSPIGYETPRPPDWLIVRGDIESVQGSWGWEASSMDVDGALRLRDWLSSLSRSEPLVGTDSAYLQFDEPGLTFEALEDDGDDVVIRLSVFDYVLHAGGEVATGRTRLDTDFEVSRSTLGSAAAEWAAEIQAFPERTRTGRPKPSGDPAR